MDFRTIVEISHPGFSINHCDNLLLIGSCFTEHIGNLLSKNLFNADCNPFGIIYNPVSINNSLNFLINNKIFIDSELNFFNEKWFNFYFHGRFSHSDKNTCLNFINERMQFSSKRLLQTKYIFLTFGTAWVYEYKKTGEIVSNCHKIPSKEFERRLLSVDEIVESYTILLNNINDKIPGVKIIFTISPIRHWKDGATGNQVSKATLMLAIQKLVDKNCNASYFPSYEIVMDELRDYRFYEEDMLHVNQVAIKYIWEKFTDTYFSKHTLEVLKDISPVIKASEHRIQEEETVQTKKFISATLRTIENLQVKYPEINFEKVRRLFEV